MYIIEGVEGLTGQTWPLKKAYKNKYYAEKKARKLTDEGDGYVYYQIKKK